MDSLGMLCTRLTSAISAETQSMLRPDPIPTMLGSCMKSHSSGWLSVHLNAVTADSAQADLRSHRGAAGGQYFHVTM